VRFSTHFASGAGGLYPRRRLSERHSHKRVVERPFLGFSTPGLGVCEVNGPWILPNYGPQAVQRAATSRGGILVEIGMGPYLLLFQRCLCLSSEPSEVKALFQRQPLPAMAIEQASGRAERRLIHTLPISPSPARRGSRRRTRISVDIATRQSGC